eukprot:523630-Pleurochrysis_carterae.AAC.1
MARSLHGLCAQSQILIILSRQVRLRWPAALDDGRGDGGDDGDDSAHPLELRQRDAPQDAPRHHEKRRG